MQQQTRENYGLELSCEASENNDVERLEFINNHIIIYIDGIITKPN